MREVSPKTGSHYKYFFMTQQTNCELANKNTFCITQLNFFVLQPAAIVSYAVGFLPFFPGFCLESFGNISYTDQMLTFRIRGHLPAVSHL